MDIQNDIDNYLTGKMSESEKAAFEDDLSRSMELREAVHENEQMIKGIQEARKLELKAILDNVQVSGPLGPISLKAGLATLSVGLASLILYFSIRVKEPEKQLFTATPHNDPPTLPRDAQSSTISSVNENVPPLNKSKQNKENISTPSDKHISNLKNQPLATHKKAQLPAPPTPFDINSPSERVRKTARLQKMVSSNLHNQIEVELGPLHKDYSFHYKFINNKLILYGPFNEHIYELIEINISEPVLYLYYKEEYYYLNKKETEVVPLIQVRDSELIKKLKFYKNKLNP